MSWEHRNHRIEVDRNGNFVVAELGDFESLVAAKAAIDKYLKAYPLGIDEQVLIVNGSSRRGDLAVKVVRLKGIHRGWSRFVFHDCNNQANIVWPNVPWIKEALETIEALETEAVLLRDAVNKFSVLSGFGRDQMDDRIAALVPELKEKCQKALEAAGMTRRVKLVWPEELP